MAITVDGTPTSGTYSAGGNSNITISHPTGIAVGDLLITLIAPNESGTPTWTTPTGWTLISNDNSSSATLYLAYRIFQSGDPASWNWKASAFTDGGWGMIALAGADSTPTIIESALDDNFSGGVGQTPVPFASVATSSADTISLLCASLQLPSSVTAPAGYTQAFFASDGVNAGWLAYNLTDTTANWSAVNATPSAGCLYKTRQLAIKVAAGGPVTTNLTLTATQAQAAALGRQVIVVRSASSSSSASLPRQTAHSATTATSPASGTLSKAASHAVAASQGSAASTVRSVGIIRSASASAVATLVTGIAHLITLAATTATSASLRRSIGKGLVASASAPAAVTRTIGKGLAASAATSAALSRAIGKGLAAMLGGVAALSRAIGKGLGTIVGGATSLTGLAVAAPSLVISRALLADFGLFIAQLSDRNSGTAGPSDTAGSSGHPGDA